MVEIAGSKTESDSDLNETFIRCIKNDGVDPLNPTIPKVYKELSRKIFHAQVNEYQGRNLQIGIGQAKFLLTINN